MKSNNIRHFIIREIEAALNELKSPEEVAADKAEVLAAQASMKAAQAKLKKAQEKLTQKEDTIKLKSLIEQEDAEDPPAEEGGDENPFAAAEDKPADTEEPAAAGDAGDAGEEKEEKPADDKKADAPNVEDITLDFNISRVKKYNPDKRFLGTQGVLKKITKDGMFLNVIPDNVEIFVNFSDID
jgi:hypothetical protein